MDWSAYMVGLNKDKPDTYRVRCTACQHDCPQSAITQYKRGRNGNMAEVCPSCGKSWVSHPTLPNIRTSVMYGYKVKGKEE
jgi:Pyruvate/2-oxoacid:ferredoxin oxidoreductase delta subunit